MAIRTNQELTRLQQENVNAYKLIKVEGTNTKKVPSKQSDSLVSTSNGSEKVSHYYPYSRKLILKELQ
jgi:hypothetical protein